MIQRAFDRIFGPVPGIRWLILGIAAVAIACAVLAKLVARNDFPTFGKALWWSVQTVTTVGYGDIVPRTDAGRAVAALLMVSAVGFLSVFTAAISAGFVHRLQSRRGTAAEDRVLAALERIEQRLDALAAERPPGESSR